MVVRVIHTIKAKAEPGYRDDHVRLLKQGVVAWNAWRLENLDIRPDLGSADFSKADLSGADLSEANLDEADLSGADLSEANLDEASLFTANLSGANLARTRLSRANLSRANLARTDFSGAILSDVNLDGANLSGAKLFWALLTGANLSNANLSRADLRDVNLSGADLSEANLSEAVLCEAYLEGSTLVGTDLAGADLTGCRIHGVSAWGLKLDNGTKQQNLIITHRNEPEVTVDNIEVAQFIYLMLHNQKIRDVIDTITSKAVLILGRFTEERKAVLDAIREELRRRNYLPILFDFDKPANRDVTETISLLARMARFVVADITDAKAIPQELNVIVPDLPSVPVQPLLLKESGEYGMFEHYARYPWVLPIYRYETQDQLIAALGEHVIEPAERKSLELRSARRAD